MIPKQLVISRRIKILLARIQRTHAASVLILILGLCWRIQVVIIILFNRTVVLLVNSTVVGITRCFQSFVIHRGYRCFTDELALLADLVPALVLLP